MARNLIHFPLASFSVAVGFRVMWLPTVVGTGVSACPGVQYSSVVWVVTH